MNYGSPPADPAADLDADGSVSGTLAPPTPASLPIGPRSVVPAGRASLGRREKKPKKPPPQAPPPTPEPDLVSPLADTGPWAYQKEQPDLSMEASSPRQLVRPYARTGGRTHVGYRLELETLLSTALSHERERAALRNDLRAICELCLTPRSTAEVSAHLRLPLGAARVLIADVVDLGLLHVHESADDKPSMDLLYRIAAGLRNL